MPYWVFSLLLITQKGYTCFGMFDDFKLVEKELALNFENGIKHLHGTVNVG